MIHVLVICAGLLGLNACGGDVGLAMLAASTASFIHTDKTVVDHAASSQTRIVFGDTLIPPLASAPVAALHEPALK